MSELSDVVGQILDGLHLAGGQVTSARAWDELERSEFTRAGIPESLGGTGGSRADAALIVTAAAEHAVSLPLTEAVLVSGYAADRTVRTVPGGMITVAVPDGAATVSAARVGSGWQLSGTARRVPWARDARSVLVVARVGQAHLILTWLSPGAFTIKPGQNMAGEPRDDICVQGYRVEATGADLHPVAIGEDLLAVGALGRTCEMLGALRGCLRMTVSYAQQRRQFGRPIGANQAVSHAIVEMAGEVAATEASSAAAIALLGPAGPLTADAHIAVGVARVQAARAATKTAAIAHQVHGAMGLTTEHPLHRYSTRLWSWRDEYGSQRSWARRLTLHVRKNNCLLPDLTRIRE